MRSILAALRSLVLPTGVTSGTRIVLDGVNGSIVVYDSTNTPVLALGGSGGGIITIDDTTGQVWLRTKRTTDGGSTAVRFQATVDGQLGWGSGGAVIDTTLTHSAGGELTISGNLVVGGAVSTTNGVDGHPEPSSETFTAWAFDTAAIQSTFTPTAGIVYLAAMYIPKTTTPTGVCIQVPTAGTGLTNCFAGLYDNTGTLLATSADMSTALQTTGAKALSIAPGTIGAGKYWAALLIGGATTSPAMNAGGNVLRYGGAPFRFSRSGTGQTSLPATITLSGVSGLNNSPWFAVR